MSYLYSDIRQVGFVVWSRGTAVLYYYYCVYNCGTDAVRCLPPRVSLQHAGCGAALCTLAFVGMLCNTSECCVIVLHSIPTKARVQRESAKLNSYEYSSVLLRQVGRGPWPSTRSTSVCRRTKDSDTHSDCTVTRGAEAIAPCRLQRQRAGPPPQASCPWRCPSLSCRRSSLAWGSPRGQAAPDKGP